MALIRPRTDNDLDACIALLHRVYSIDRYPVNGLSNTREFLAGHGVEHSWVAETGDGQVVGQVSVSTASEQDIACTCWWATHPNDHERRIAVLGRLFVDPARRGAGIAAQLVRTAEAWGRDHGSRLVLFVLLKDGTAEKLYRRLGWVHFGQSTFHYGDDQRMDAACFVSSPDCVEGDAKPV